MFVIFYFWASIVPLRSQESFLATSIHQWVGSIRSTYEEDVIGTEMERERERDRNMELALLQLPLLVCYLDDGPAPLNGSIDRTRRWIRSLIEQLAC
jgi:hypothetical protein